MSTPRYKIGGPVMFLMLSVSKTIHSGQALKWQLCILIEQVLPAKMISQFMGAVRYKCENYLIGGIGGGCDMLDPIELWLLYCELPGWTFTAACPIICSGAGYCGVGVVMTFASGAVTMDRTLLRVCAFTT